jgi:uracil-DNA glycosylase family 4
VPTAQIAPVETKPAAPALPDTLAAFRTWLLADASVPGAVRGRVDALGDHATGAVIVVDMPEADDRASGTLLSGEVGALFDRMLGAIKLSRADIYLVPFSPSRSTTGRVGDADLATLTSLLRHHLTLAAPKRLLLLGDAPVQALLRMPAAKAREAVHMIEIEGRQVPTVASIHPRLVHLKRDYRPLAWDDLQRFAAL